MHVKFSSFEKLETPLLTVCNPGCTYYSGRLSNVVGILSDVSDIELVMNFNSVSELSFRAYKIKREQPVQNTHAYTLYRALQNRRLIFVEGVGFFVITKIADGYSDGVFYKDITASSCEEEIAAKNLTYIEDGTYQFTSLLETIAATLPNWAIGDVTPSVASRYRTFEDVATELNTLAFMLENMQDAYECIFIFDTINRRINVLDQNDYIHQTDIHITKDDLINSIDISESSDDLYTAISVFGDENLHIAPINPLGTSVLYNFNYYLSWMTEELRAKVVAWQDLVASSQEAYYDLNLNYYEKLTAQSELESNLNKLDIQLTLYRRCRENIVAASDTSQVEDYNAAIAENGGAEIVVYEEIADTLAAIDELIAAVQLEMDITQASLNILEVEIAEIKTRIEDVRESVSIKNYFSAMEYHELYNYIYEGTYSDEYITVTDSMTYSEKFQQMKALYDRAVAQLERISKPTQEFSIDVENFIFVQEFKAWSEQLETGCLINVELSEGDVAPLFLSAISINYEDLTLQLTFGNRLCKFDPKSLFTDVLGKVKKSANTLDYIRDIVHPITNGEFNSMREALQTSRTLTKNAVLSSTNQEVVIDDTGYTGKRLLHGETYDPRQVKIANHALVFTDDAWETCKVALGEIILGENQVAYGINAETIIGDLIMGGGLRILDSNGNELLTVVDGRISSAIYDLDSEYDTRISAIEQTASGIEIRITAIEEGEVDSVTTSTGYTFNKDGLTIHKDGEEIENLMDNTGMYVRRRTGETAENILTANNEGVNAINLTSRQYLIVGANSRFEDYNHNGDTRTACFYTGG